LIRLEEFSSDPKILRLQINKFVNNFGEMITVIEWIDENFAMLRTRIGSDFKAIPKKLVEHLPGILLEHKSQSGNPSRTQKREYNRCKRENLDYRFVHSNLEFMMNYAEKLDFVISYLKECKKNE